MDMILRRVSCVKKHELLRLSMIEPERTRERTHVYYEKTINKFAMISRQPDIGLRQYRIALAQDRLLVPLGEKCTSLDCLHRGSCLLGH